MKMRTTGRRTRWLAGAAAIALMIFGATQLVGNDAPADPAPMNTPTQPVETTPLTRDDALRHALEADPSVRREMLLAEPQGQFLCSLRVLGSSPSGDRLYLWLGCSDFVVADSGATNRSGSSEPAVVQVRGSGTDIQLEKVSFPRQQSLDADIKRLFPPSIANHIYDEESTRTSPSEKELEAEAVRNAAG
jgi:hypothetical protein